MSFQVISASAGSGKTYTLNYEVLKLILAPEKKRFVRNILAITFTNKAANEMKFRLLKTLKEITRKTDTSLITRLSEDLKLTEQTIVNSARKRLKEVLFNYDDLAYSTIDTFTFKLIRHFSKELGLNTSINVEMNDYETVDELIETFLRNLSEDHHLIDELKNLSLRQIEEDKSWDVFPVLSRLKNYILPDSYRYHIEILQSIDEAQIIRTREDIRRQISGWKKKLEEKASELMEIINRPHIKKSVSRVNDLINLLDKISQGEIPDPNKTFVKWFVNADMETLLKKNGVWADEDRNAVYNLTRKIFSDLTRLQKLVIFLRAITPLSLIRTIGDEINRYKEENDVIFISDFNKIIGRVVSDNPTPFIYRRTGEKYFYHFIDEFQDTSTLQWENIKPLIAETLSKEVAPEKTGSAHLLGDAKQAIYRFRGGDPEQFIKLTSPQKNTPDHHPFPNVEKINRKLKHNWRSAKEIVLFNNVFFTNITSAFALHTEMYHEVYREENVKQEPKKNFDGYVEMHWKAHQDDEEYLTTVWETVRKLIRQKQYAPGDIAVLYNRKTEGARIAELLVGNGIKVISDDSLELKNARKLNLLINLYRFFDTENTAFLLDALWDYQAVKQVEFSTGFIEALSRKTFTEIIHTLSAKDHLPKWKHLSPYAFFSALIDALDLHDGRESAYLKLFMSEVNRAESQYLTPSGFIDYWEKVLSKSAIENIPAQDAVRLLTVHKAKGLEFPVVIYAYANQEVEPKSDNLVWIPTQNLIDIPYVPVNYSDLKRIYELSGDYKMEFNAFREASVFDLINKIYVAFTRPVEKLYVLAGNPVRSKNNTAQIFSAIAAKLPGALSGAHINTAEALLQYGEEKPSSASAGSGMEYFDTGFHTKIKDPETAPVRIDTRSIDLWSETKRKPVEVGLTVHQYLSEIECLNDWKRVKKRIKSGLPEEIAREVISRIEQVLRHPELSFMFDCNNTILTERPVLMKQSFRPDRIVIERENRASVLDYKTGKHDARYEKQLEQYARLLREAGFNVTRKWIVYVGDTIRIIKLP